MGSNRGAPCGFPVCSLSAGQMLLLQHLKLLFDTRTYQVTRTPLPCQDGHGFGPPNAYSSVPRAARCHRGSCAWEETRSAIPFMSMCGDTQAGHRTGVRAATTPVGFLRNKVTSRHAGHPVPFLPITTTAAPCPKCSSLGAGPKPSPTSAEPLSSLHRGPAACTECEWVQLWARGSILGRFR